MLYKKIAFATFVFLFSMCVAAAQQAQEPLTIARIVQMNKDGVPADLIIATITSQKAVFKLSTDEITRLSTVDKLPSDVIKAMMATATTADQANVGSAPAQPVYVDSDDPADLHSPGIWLMTAENKMVKLQPARPIANQSGGGFGFGKVLGGAPTALGGIVGARAGGTTGAILGAGGGNAVDQVMNAQEVKVELDQKNASIKTGPSPTFYFYFDPNSSTSAPGFAPVQQSELFLGQLSQVTNPNDFSLVKLDDKSGHREVKVSSYNVRGQRVGVDKDKTIGFQVEELRAGVFKVTVAKPLEQKKEYAFVAKTLYSGSPLYGGEMIAPNMFDFSVPKE